MKVSELKKAIADVPDDFEFEIDVEKKVPEEELAKRDYPYPIDTERCSTDASNFDIGWSDKKIKLNVRVS